MKRSTAKKLEIPRGEKRQFYKQQLLEMAKNNHFKPTYKESILYNVLYTSTNPLCEGYDENFADQIKSIRPDWFIHVSVRVADNKAILLEIAKQGLPKPLPPSKIGRTLWNYTWFKSPVFDPLFKEEISQIRPDWFKKREPLQLDLFKIIEIIKKSYISHKNIQYLFGVCGQTIDHWQEKNKFPKPEKVKCKSLKSYKTKNVLNWLNDDTKMDKLWCFNRSKILQIRPILNAIYNNISIFKNGKNQTLFVKNLTKEIGESLDVIGFKENNIINLPSDTEESETFLKKVLKFFT